MSDIVLKVENLTKEYRLGTIGYGSLREDMQSMWARMRNKDDPNSLVTAKHNSGPDKNHFLALDDISFEVNRGDRVGIIGHNGAGKSSLLKILSRITSPTKGNIYINGNIGSLLEVGTGFHPELTGLENIYLNGSILGMSKNEVKKKLDEIIDFSGIEKFIDTPVKRYSSGMKVRLGFSVASHLDSEIMIVDEVLAVGDYKFRHNATEKMKKISEEDGKTILFVSHNMSSIRSLCNKGLLLKSGKLIASGPTDNIISKYTESITNNPIEQIEYRKDRKGTGKLFFTELKIQNEILHSGDSFILNVFFSVKTYLNDIIIRFSVFDDDDNLVFICNNEHLKNGLYEKLDKGKYKLEFCINDLPLNEGRYYVNIASHDSDGLLDSVTKAMSFFVENGDFYDSGKKPKKGILLRYDFNLESLI